MLNLHEKSVNFRRGPFMYSARNDIKIRPFVVRDYSSGNYNFNVRSRLKLGVTLMIDFVKSKLYLKKNICNEEEYANCVRDLISDNLVRSMKDFMQHRDSNCLDHSLYVSYNSYLICKWLGFDYRSAARGGLLHDFYLYDWHSQKPYKGLHGFMHPRIALQNANKQFYLNTREKDIILKHMWPLTVAAPKYRETFIVLCIDKYCACMEIFKIGGRDHLIRIQRLFP